MMWAKAAPRDKVAHLWRTEDATLCGSRAEFVTHYPAGKADRCKACQAVLNGPITGYRPPKTAKRRAAR